MARLLASFTYVFLRLAKKVNFLERDDFDEEQVLTHEIMLELGYPSTLNFRDWSERFSVKMPAFYTQHAMSQDKIAGCSSWIWDTGSKVNLILCYRNLDVVLTVVRRKKT